MNRKISRNATIVTVLVIVSLYPLLAIHLVIEGPYRQGLESDKAQDLVALADHAKARIESAITRMRNTVHIVSSHTELFQSLASLDRDEASINTDIHFVLHAAAASLDSQDRILLYDNELNLVASYVGHSGRLSEYIPSLDNAVKSLVSSPTSNTQIDPIRIDNRLAIVGYKTIERHGEVFGHIAIVFDPAFLRSIMNADAGLGSTGEWLFAIRGPDNEAIFAMPLRYDPEAALTRTVPAERLDVPITQALLGNECVMTNAPDYRDHPVLAVTRYLDEVDWGLIAKINQDEVVAPVHEANRLLLVIGSGSLALLASMSWLLSYLTRSRDDAMVSLDPCRVDQGECLSDGEAVGLDLASNRRFSDLQSPTTPIPSILQHDDSSGAA